MQADKIEPHLPPLSCGEHIVEYLFEVGPLVAGGMGPAAIDWSHLDAWQRCAGLALPPWQCHLLIRLSGAYLSEWMRAQEPTCPPPWQPDEMTERNRAAVSRQVSNGMKAFMMSRETRR